MITASDTPLTLRKQTGKNKSITHIVTFSFREGLLSYPDLNDFLVKGYAKQIKERNQATGENLAP